MDGTDDLGAKLAQLLDNPEEMEKLKNMAETLMGESGHSDNKGPDLSSLFGGLDIGTVMQLGNLLRSDAEDDRTRLLMALKPHLSAPRQDKVDRAVKLLRIASILPLISKQGLI